MKYKLLILIPTCWLILSFQTEKAKAVEFSTYHGNQITYYTDDMSYKFLNYEILNAPTPIKRKERDRSNLGRYLLIHMQAVNDNSYEKKRTIECGEFTMFNGPNRAKDEVMPKIIQDPGYENVNSDNKTGKVKVKQNETKKFDLLYIIYPENDLSFLMGSFQSNAKVVSLHKSSSKNGITSD